MPPHVIFQRIHYEIRVKLDKKLIPRRVKYLTLSRLLKLTGTNDLTELWEKLAKRAFPANLSAIDVQTFEECCPNTVQTIYEKAQQASKHCINLLGTGNTHLGEDINWHKDYKTGHVWDLGYFDDLHYINLDSPSDVKIPWEISRMQWLIPLGQAYLLCGDERYALKVRELLADWIAKNPYAHSVNWTCTMEVALRIIVWTWFFHVFNKSNAWQNESFRTIFLSNLYLHAEFTSRHLERSDVNGNHYTANAAGLVFAGLFFGDYHFANQWRTLGWKILTAEINLQVYADGVNHEASIPYHRLVTELFLLPALYLEACQINVEINYKNKLIDMAHFIASYTKPSGLAPLWGDADDARVLPFGMQAINDHRYLIGIIASHWNVTSLKEKFSGDYDEIFWLCHSQAVTGLKKAAKTPIKQASKAFVDGGFYILTNCLDHIFIDCGPVGLRGRGGHGHNDCLSFEADLLGKPLITDCGAYLYTANYRERNLFRSTAYHNTPQIDEQEINRFIRWDHLWNFHNDAKPNLHQWYSDSEKSVFCGSHTGYLKLVQPITPKRTISLFHDSHILIIHDEFLGAGTHKIKIPMHFHPQVKITPGIMATEFYLQVDDQQFLLQWWPAENWSCQLAPARVSPSYGVIQNSSQLIWENQDGVCEPLTVCIRPFASPAGWRSCPQD